MLKLLSIIIFFISNISVASLCSELLKKDLPFEIQNALISQNEFTERYTENGVFFHGTVVPYAKAIMESGNATWRSGSPGFFVTDQYWDVAFTYGQMRFSEKGVVLPLKIIDGVKATILDFTKISDARLSELLRENTSVKYSSTDKSIYYDAFGVDIVIHRDGVAAIHNDKILDIPKSFYTAAARLAKDYSKWQHDGVTWESYQNLFNELTQPQRRSLPEPSVLRPESYIPRRSLIR